MKVVDKEYVFSKKEVIIEAIRGGSIFIYPTDTIYGLGCNALLTDSVEKIRIIKKRDTKPFSIIAPSVDWILENCEVTKESVVAYLPGPYTLFVKRRNMTVSKSINLTDDTLGIRIPDHWFTEIIKEAGVPFVTTSVNISGERYMQNLEEVPQEILEKMDYVVYEGEKKGVPSEKVNLVK